MATVPAGLTALQGLDRVAKLKTRYGGRYVRAVDGLAEHGRTSWFYYVNGYLADQGSAEYRLRAGDVEWWDYRSWRDPLDDAVVVGAFPEPLVHGYGGKRRPTVVLSGDRPLGTRIARLVGGSVARTARPTRTWSRSSRNGPGRSGSTRSCESLVPARRSGSSSTRGSPPAPVEAAARPLPLLGAVSPVPAAALLAGLAAAALLADRTISVAAIALVLLAICLRAPPRGGASTCSEPCFPGSASSSSARSSPRSARTSSGAGRRCPCWVAST